MVKRDRVIKVAAGTMTLAALPVLSAAACGGDDSTNKEATQPVPTQPVNTGAGSQTAAKSTFLFLDADTVRGSKNIATADKATQSCVQLSRFQKNEEIVFRVRVYDPSTGKAMDDQSLAKVEVKLKDGTTLDPAKYGPHPKDPPNEYFWTTSWVIPEGYATGTLDYTITATDKEGRSGTFKQLPLAPLTVTETVRPIVPTQ